MKRRGLFQQVARQGVGLALGAAGLTAISGTTAAANPSLGGRTWGKIGTSRFVTIDGARPFLAWWEEFHSQGRFERRLQQLLTELRVQEWRNDVPHRVILDGMIYSALLGWRPDGDCLLHAQTMFDSAGGDRGVHDHRLGNIAVSIHARDQETGECAWWIDRSDYVWWPKGPQRGWRLRPLVGPIEEELS